MEFKDYYATMGVARDASPEEIKRTYRKLARKYHPDVSKERNAEARFKDIGEAYEVLKDPEKREAYDRLGANWKAGQEFTPPPGTGRGFDSRAGRGGQGAEFSTGGFSDFFESVFGRGGFERQAGREFHARGEDSVARIEIEVEDAYRGATREISLRDVLTGTDGRPTPRDRSLNVRIPKGVRRGQQIRLAGQGGRGLGRGEAGDLFLEIDFRPHALYKVEDKDVFLTLPVAPWEAALGATIQVPTPAGPVELRIPSNSAGGRKLRLKGRGIPAREPGDFYVVLEIALPPADSAESRAAYAAFEQATGFDPRADFARPDTGEK